MPVLLRAPPALGTLGTPHRREPDAPLLTSTSSLEALSQDVGGEKLVEFAAVKLSSCCSERSNEDEHRIMFEKEDAASHSALAVS